MFTITMDYWKLGLIVVAVMMLGYLIIQAISWGIDTLLYRKKKIKIDEPPKQSKLIVDVPGPSDDIQAKNLKIWVADLDDTVQYLTSEFNDTKENFESFKQAVDDTISEQQEQIKKLEETTKDFSDAVGELSKKHNINANDITLLAERLNIAEVGLRGAETKISINKGVVDRTEKSIDALEAAAKDEIDNMYQRVRIAELGIDKLEDRVNAIEHDIGDAFEEIHNNANEIDCVRRKGEKSQPIFIEKDIFYGTPGLRCGPTTLTNAINILSKLRKEISNNGFVSIWYLDKLIDCPPDEDDQTIGQFSKFIKHTTHGWFDLRKAYISLNPENKKYYINLPDEVKLYLEEYEADWSEPIFDRVPIYHEGFTYLGDAAKVLNMMRHNVEDHGFTTLEDFERAVGVEDIEFTDGNYGWEDLSNAYIIKRDCEDNKFYVIMPRIIVLDKNKGGD